MADDAHETRPSDAGPHPSDGPAHGPVVASTIPDTIISIIMTLALAFLFRAFVVEAFVIPTGSMAPTLLGAHYRVHSPSSGATFAVDRRIGDTGRQEFVRDPYTAEPLGFDRSARLDGDRIFVRKRTPLTPLPDRFDVVVFRSPTEPDERVIKRLVGRPGEQVALVDGDVFVRASSGREAPDASSWSRPGWSIARKPEAVQRAVWQPVFDAAYTPMGAPSSLGPWSPTTQGWAAGPSPVARYTESGPTALVWDTDAWEIRDRSAYNDVDDRRDPRVGDGGLRGGLPPHYPVSDLRVAFGYAPTDATASAEIRLGARSTEFSFRIVGVGEHARAELRSRPATLGPDGEAPAWTVLAEAAVSLPTGRATEIECWHADQALTMFVGGRRVVDASYDWDIGERLARTLPGRDLDELLDISDGHNGLSEPNAYGVPELAVLLDGPAALHRLRVDRDLYYHPFHPQFRVQGDPPPLATHPNTTVTLGPGQLFVLGDNSPASRDGRSWGKPDPWVAAAFPSTATEGVVPMQLLIGEAFVVYFPALHREGLVPVPDFGRMRLIR